MRFHLSTQNPEWPVLNMHPAGLILKIETHTKHSNKEVRSMNMAVSMTSK